MKEGKVEAVMLTLSKGFFKEYPGGEDAVRKSIEHMNDSDKWVWNMTCGGGIPKIETEFVYIIFDNKVQYRANVVCFKKKETMTFSDGRCLENKNWIVIQGPIIKAPHDIPQKGFQGFRYSPFIF
jgi:hypothetical protein